MKKLRRSALWPTVVFAAGLILLMPTRGAADQDDKHSLRTGTEWGIGEPDQPGNSTKKSVSKGIIVLIVPGIGFFHPTLVIVIHLPSHMFRPLDD
jgi:hypothetical protein